MSNNCWSLPGLDNKPTGCLPVLSFIESETLDITGDGSLCKPLGLEVKISEEEGNILTKNDGLYASAGGYVLRSTGSMQNLHVWNTDGAGFMSFDTAAGSLNISRYSTGYIQFNEDGLYINNFSEGGYIQHNNSGIVLGGETKVYAPLSVYNNHNVYSTLNAGYIDSESWRLSTTDEGATLNGNLSVAGSASFVTDNPLVIQRATANNNNQLEFRYSSNNLLGYIRGQGNNQLLINSTNRIILDSTTAVTSGLLGVGGQVPSGTWLHIPGSVSNRSAIRLESGVAPTTPVTGDMWRNGNTLNINVPTLGGINGIQFATHANNFFTSTVGGSTTFGANTRLWFNVAGANTMAHDTSKTTLSTLVRIEPGLANPNVAPSHNLDVRGTTYESANFKRTLGSGTGQSTLSTLVTVEAENTDSTRRWGFGMAAGNFVINERSANTFPFRVNAAAVSDTLGISANSNVLIGTATDSTAKLRVNGDVRIDVASINNGLLIYNPAGNHYGTITTHGSGNEFIIDKIGGGNTRLRNAGFSAYINNNGLGLAGAASAGSTLDITDYSTNAHIRMRPKATAPGTLQSGQFWNENNVLKFSDGVKTYVIQMVEE